MKYFLFPHQMSYLRPWKAGRNSPKLICHKRIWTSFLIMYKDLAFRGVVIMAATQNLRYEIIIPVLYQC